MQGTGNTQQQRPGDGAKVASQGDAQTQRERVIAELTSRFPGMQNIQKDCGRITLNTSKRCNLEDEVLQSKSQVSQVISNEEYKEKKESCCLQKLHGLMSYCCSLVGYVSVVPEVVKPTSRLVPYINPNPTPKELFQEVLVEISSKQSRSTNTVNHLYMIC